VTILRISDAAELLGVSDDTVRRWAAAGRLRTQRASDGRQGIEGRDLAEFAVTYARHADHGGGGASARNRLRGIVTSVVRDTVMAQVEMQAGPYRLVSLMSREAADELGLEPGVVADAVVKATQVIVEVADTR
jgi:molybdopterin-binding protein